MGSPDIMAAWDEMCLKCAEYDAMVEQRDAARRINTQRTAIWKAQERVMARMCEERDDALALAERRAGERDRLRDWLNIAKVFVWDEEIVENIDAELAGASPASEGDREGAR